MYTYIENVQRREKERSKTYMYMYMYIHKYTCTCTQHHIKSFYTTTSISSLVIHVHVQMYYTYMHATSCTVHTYIYIYYMYVIHVQVPPSASGATGPGRRKRDSPAEVWQGHGGKSTSYQPLPTHSTGRIPEIIIIQ